MNNVENNTKLFVEAIDRLNVNDKDLTEEESKVLLILKLLKNKCKILSYYPYDYRITFNENNIYTESFVLMRRKGYGDEIKLEYKGYKIQFVRPSLGSMNSFYFKIYNIPSGIVIDETDLDEVIYNMPLYWELFISRNNSLELIELFEKKLYKTLDEIIEYKEEEKLLHKIYRKR